MKVGYCRVSTSDQSLEVQRDALKAAGCERIYEEKASGRNADNRRELQSVLGFIREGDALVVTKLDRLARSVRDLMAIHDQIVEKGAALCILNMGLDTKTATGKLMLGVLGSVAEFERDITHERQREGIERVKRNGETKADGTPKYAGRKPTIDRERVIEMLDQKIGPSRIARELEIGESSVFRIKREHEAGENAAA